MTGNPFPLPEWLNLSEVPAYVMERMGSAPLDLIVRAIQDDQLRTRARCRSYTGHETQVPMDGWAWDDATVDWAADRFTTPAGYGSKHIFDKVEVERAGRYGLDHWLGLTPAQKAIETGPDRKAAQAFTRPADITKRENSLLRIIAFLAIRAYSVNPNAENVDEQIDGIFRHITDAEIDAILAGAALDLKELGEDNPTFRLSVSRNTLRDRLREAIDLVMGDQRADG